ncbi:hypothetical protein WS58_00885 [Burkholderia pseudomultivorans]|uniref:hypothetical protein n=1 Tax=Burkholderia pseudomultivorans TaxID=1207504 RepID=UPI00075EA999|nr:hypothetical protein [Burkholderia pseudomultivorans]KVC27001.1 hypothetical protein WS56_24590 [Burkholderia pseudomultivorans]KVC28044.1 hypothetical protein WS55_11460 [Burkholderia pseudomultivorans]KVC41028.1 hypothetical protein WS58_00885 [Burkholderia pseudomultivorans]
MSMQDITGHYAIPLALPYSDVPPPYGRRRRPFVASRRPRPSVFDIYGPRPAQAAMPARDAGRIKVTRPVRAEDFGSDNRAWVRPHPIRRRWRMTALATAMFGLVCVVATHLFDARQHGPMPGSVYAAAISIAPEAIAGAPMAAVSAMADSIEAADTRSVVPTAGAATVVAAQAAPAASALAGTQSASRDGAAATQPARRAASRPVSVARGSAQAGPARAVAEAKPAAVARSRKTHDGVAGRQHRAAPVAEVAHAMPPRGRDTQAAAAEAAASTPTAAEAVGMTAAEFTHWLAATRETARPAAVSTPSGTRGTDLTVNLPSHTRLIER